MVPILDYLLIAFSQPTAIIKVRSINTILHFVILNVVNEREESEEKNVSVFEAVKLWLKSFEEGLEMPTFLAAAAQNGRHMSIVATHSL